MMKPLGARRRRRRAKPTEQRACRTADALPRDVVPLHRVVRGGSPHRGWV